MKIEKIVKSEFRKSAYLQPFLLILFTLFFLGGIALSVMVFVIDTTNFDKAFIYKYFYMPGFSLSMLYFCIYLIYVCRFRCDKIIISDQGVQVKKFFGLGANYTFLFREIEFYPSLESVKIGNGEKEIIVVDKIRITELSDLFYKNYYAMIKKIPIHKQRNTFSGFPDNHWDKLKSAFKSNRVLR